MTNCVATLAIGSPCAPNGGVAGGCWLLLLGDICTAICRRQSGQMQGVSGGARRTKLH